MQTLELCENLNSEAIFTFKSILLYP